MKNVLSLFFLLLVCASTHAQVPAPLKAHGVRINVTDLDAAMEFYVNKLQFKVENKGKSEVILLTTEGDRIVLIKVNNLLPELESETRVGFTLLVNDLDSTIARLRRIGVDFGTSQKRKEGVGYAISIFDPFGTAISLMHLTVVNVPRFAEPRLYNYGFKIPDMDRARAFFKQLGFSERSEKYLPNDMPLGHSDNTFAFMLHFRHGVQAVQHNSVHSEHVIALFSARDLVTAVDMLVRAGAIVLDKAPTQGALGKTISFRDPFGYVSEVIEVRP